MAVQAQQLKLQELTNDYYSLGLLTRPQFLTAKATAEANLQDLTKQLNGTGCRRKIKLDLTGTLRETWANASIEWKRAVELLVDRVVVNPYEAGFKVVWWNRFRFDPTRVRIEWRV